MSRSNPNVNAPNPAARWFEWNGEKGVIRYYDKATSKYIEVASGFTFLVLDELASVRGWHDASSSGIYSNEVRDTSKDVMVVKAFKGGTLAEGIYKTIKDRINSQGGKFVANCYVAVKLGEKLEICSVRFKGAALGAWMEFRKANRQGLYESAVKIVGATEGKKGRITFYTPKFELKEVSAESNTQAMALDKALQSYLDGYLQRKTRDQAEDTDENDDYDPSTDPSDQSAPLTNDDIPF